MAQRQARQQLGVNAYQAKYTATRIVNSDALSAALLAADNGAQQSVAAGGALGGGRAAQHAQGGLLLRPLHHLSQVCRTRAQQTGRAGRHGKAGTNRQIGMRERQGRSVECKESAGVEGQAAGGASEEDRQQQTGMQRHAEARKGERARRAAEISSGTLQAWYAGTSTRRLWQLTALAQRQLAHKGNRLLSRCPSGG